MLHVGLIGSGPQWEHRYRPVLVRLRHRLRVRAVHAAVRTQAEQIAAELDCDVSPGLVTLFEREDVRAVLVLDAGWYRGAPAEFACRLRKPAYVSCRLADHLCIAPEAVRDA